MGVNSFGSGLFNTNTTQQQTRVRNDDDGKEGERRKGEYIERTKGILMMVRKARIGELTKKRIEEKMDMVRDCSRVMMMEGREGRWRIEDQGQRGRGENGDCDDADEDRERGKEKKEVKDREIGGKVVMIGRRKG